MKNKASKSSYSCISCSYQSVKWFGCCPGCAGWDTFEQIEAVAPSSFTSNGSTTPAVAIPMQSINAYKVTKKKRLCTNIDEWDRVMGGGIMPGSLLVLTGDPGIGKSTLLLQVSRALAEEHTVFYFSTEESIEQVKERASRLCDMMPDKFFISDRSDFCAIFETIETEKPEVVIIDSIQNGSLTNNRSSLPGSMSQLREATFQLMRIAKEHNIIILITSHITKEGIIAGPKTLEHMVDAVFYLHAEDRWQTRFLRAVKNRFGTINEIGFFDMTAQGLQQVFNINEQFIAQTHAAPGSALVSTLEGTRSLLLEIQSLTINSKLSLPQRVISGIDHKQVVLIAAILEKYLHIKLSAQDIFVKVSSGLRLKGSSADLAIAFSLLSSYFQKSLPERSLVLGEIGLTGHVKPINQIQNLIREAEKFGIERIYVSKNQSINSSSCHIVCLAHIYEAITLFDTQ